MTRVYQAHTDTKKKQPLHVVVEYSEFLHTAACLHFYGTDILTAHKEQQWMAGEDEWRSMLMAHLLMLESQGWGQLILDSGAVRRDVNCCATP